MRSSSPLLTVFLLLAMGLGGGATPAHAQAPAAAPAGATRSIAVASVEVAGGSSAALRAEVSQAIAASLAKSGVRVVGLDQAIAAGGGERALATCVTRECLTGMTATLGVDELVRAHVSASGNSYEIDLELLSPRADGGLAGRLQRSCEVCTVDEMNQLVAGATADLVSGAGSSTEEAETEARVEASLSATGAAPSDDRARPFRAWKWVTAGTAAAALLTGVALLMIDGGGTCDADSEQCPSVFDTRAAGFVGLSVGLLGGGASAWMFIKDAR